MHLRNTAIAIFAAALFAGPASATVTAGLVHEWSAAADDGTDNEWNDNVAGGQDPFWDLDETGQVDRVAVTGSSTTFTHAFEWDGGDATRGETDTNNGLKSGQYTEVSDGTDTTFELWTRYDASNLPSGEWMTLLDFGGGGNGAGIYLFNDDGTIQVEARPSTDDVLAQSVDAAASDFMQIVMSVDATNDAYSLFVNGSGVSDTLNTENFGGNPTGLGSQQGQAGGIDNTSVSTSPLVGQIALARIYDGNAFDQEEVNENFREILPAQEEAPAVPEPASALLALGSLVLLGVRRR